MLASRVRSSPLVRGERREERGEITQICIHRQGSPAERGEDHLLQEFITEL